MENAYLDIPNLDLVDRVVTITGTPQQILESNVRRIGLYFDNTLAAATIWIRPNVITAIGQGFTLDALIRNMRFTWPEDWNLPSREWWAVSAGIGDPLTVIEILQAHTSNRRNQT